MKKVFLLIMVLSIVFLCACGNSTATTPETDNLPAPDVSEEVVPSEPAETSAPVELTDEEIYAAFLGKLRDDLWEIVVDDTHLDGFGDKEGMIGIAEIASIHKTEMLNKIGYNICDINGDGIKELLLCEVDGSTTDTCSGTRILSAYTVVGNEAVLLFEGMSRNRYYLLDDATIYNEAALSAAEVGAGVYHLDAESDKLVCSDFYFTDLDENNNVLFLYNQTGEWDATASKPFDGDEDAFWAKNTEFSSRIQTINLIALDTVES